MSEFAKLTVVAHPLVASKLLQMRRPVDQCPQRQFTRLLRELGGHMAYEVARMLPVQREQIDLIRGNRGEGTSLSLQRLVLVQIMRSGSVMMEGFREVLTAPAVGHIGVHVDKESQKTALYLVSLPTIDTADKIFIVVDPVIATGGTALRALGEIAQLNPALTFYVTLIASQHGCDAVHEKYPNVRIYCAARDEVNLKNGNVYPGLGSVSARLFGFKTVEAEHDYHV